MTMLQEMKAFRILKYKIKLINFTLIIKNSPNSIRQIMFQLKNPKTKAVINRFL